MCAWRSVQVAKPSLAEIMSEQLVGQLETEGYSCDTIFQPTNIVEKYEADTTPDFFDESTDADFAMALALSLEEEELRNTEKFPSGDNKTQEWNQRHAHYNDNLQSSSRIEADILYAEMESNNPNFQNGLIKLSNGMKISKHDELLNGIQNAKYLSGIEGVGDLDGKGLMVCKSSTHAYNASFCVRSTTLLQIT